MFRLSQSFLKQYKGTQPNWGPLGRVTYARTYSRTTPTGSEEWFDTCKRVVEGTVDLQNKHCKKNGLTNFVTSEDAEDMFRRMWEFKWLPPGRGLWMMGTDFVDRRSTAALFNCGFVSTENLASEGPEAFAWAMDMSMLGVGVGFDTEGKETQIYQPGEADEKEFMVADTREGWVDAYLAFVTPFFDPSKRTPGSLNVSLVRPKGTPIRGFGGVSSGPDPLISLIEDSSFVLTERLAGSQSCVLGEAALVDLFNLIGRCVVSGNIRRSAMIAFGAPSSKEFVNLKNPDHLDVIPRWGTNALYHHRWASNNTVNVSVGEDYAPLVDAVRANGEPGFNWLSNAQTYARMGWGEPSEPADPRVKGGNPCLEQSLESYELCCLSEVFPSMHEDLEDLKRTMEIAFLYAKSVTLLPTHSGRTNAKQLANRRTGLSVSGIVQAIEKFGEDEFFNALDENYKLVEKFDKDISLKWAVRESIKRTSVKPSGTISLLPGVTPGVHYPHSEYYIRRIRFDEISPLVADLRDAGYPVEKDKYSPNTVVVEFPIKEKHFSRGKDDVSMLDQLELAAKMQHYWADNQVSVTVTFNKSEGECIGEALKKYETRLKGVSFLPISEHGYEQAPYETISAEEFARRAGSIGVLGLHGSAHDTTEAFCEGGLCSLPVASSDE